MVDRSLLLLLVLQFYSITERIIVRYRPCFMSMIPRQQVRYENRMAASWYARTHTMSISSALRRKWKWCPIKRFLPTTTISAAAIHPNGVLNAAYTRLLP